MKPQIQGYGGTFLSVTETIQTGLKIGTHNPKLNEYHSSVPQ